MTKWSSCGVERSDKLVRELVLDDPAPFVPLVVAKRDKDIDYEAKAVTLAGRRYIVCRNREEMKKDAAARAAILAALERQLKKGDAVAQILDAAQRGDHLLTHLRAVAAAFDNLEIGAPARGFLAEIHARNRPSDSFVVRT
jgi:hypothetical protein